MILMIFSKFMKRTYDIPEWRIRTADLWISSEADGLLIERMESDGPLFGQIRTADWSNSSKANDIGQTAQEWKERR